MRIWRALLLASCGLGCRGGEVQDLSTAQLSAVVEAQQPTLKSCYDQALEKTPYKHAMELQAIIQIEPSGEVESVQIEGTGGLPGMGPCLRDAIQKWRFPKARDATHTSLPLHFKPEIKREGPNLDDLQDALRKQLRRPE
jgi:hypothetical protein